MGYETTFATIDLINDVLERDISITESEEAREREEAVKSGASAVGTIIGGLTPLGPIGAIIGGTAARHLTDLFMGSEDVLPEYGKYGVQDTQELRRAFKRFDTQTNVGDIGKDLALALNVLMLSGVSDKIGKQGIGALADKKTWTQWGDKMNYWEWIKLPVDQRTGGYLKYLSGGAS